MSINQSSAIRIFGGDGSPEALALNNPSSQANGEALAVGTHARKARGPRRSGQFSAHIGVTAAAGATSALSIWYSNMPNPDPDNDAHWVEDTTITPVDLAATGNSFLNVGNVNAEWIRYKATIAASGGDLFLYHRAEGVEH